MLFWHVDNFEDTHRRLLAMGATEYEPITPREQGFVTATVVDPFGNVLGIMHNPHYLACSLPAAPFRDHRRAVSTLLTANT